MKDFFEPKTIAVIGASEHKEKVGYALMNNLENFKGRVVPINLKYECKTVLDYKGKIDLAVIAIPAEFVSKVLIECGKKKIKNVIVISAGFGEIGNKKAEEELIVISKKYGINLLGPNCFGVCNPSLGLDTTFAINPAKKGNIAFVSQSGALWSYISDFSLSNGFGFSLFASLGNMVGVGFNELIEYLNKDKKTKSIILYIEKLKDGKRFLEVCKQSKKRIFAIKAGSSKQGMKMAISHTGSLATDYEIYKGVFKQAGVVLCSSLVEALEKANNKKFVLNSSKKIDLGKKVHIITNAGGAGALISDYISDAGYGLYSPKDILGDALAMDYEKEVNKIKLKKNEKIIVLLTPQKMTQIKETAEVILCSKHKKKIIACFLGGKEIQKSNVNQYLKKANIPIFNTLKELKDSIIKIKNK